VSNLSMQEFVDEMVAELEDRIESHFGATDKGTIEGILRREIRAAEQRDRDPAATHHPNHQVGDGRG
jgi:hypothetical protein